MRIFYAFCKYSNSNLLCVYLKKWYSNKSVENEELNDAHKVKIIGQVYLCWENKELINQKIFYNQNYLQSIQ